MVARLDVTLNCHQLVCQLDTYQASMPTFARVHDADHADEEPCVLVTDLARGTTHTTLLPHTLAHLILG